MHPNKIFWKTDLKNYTKDSLNELFGSSGQKIIDSMKLVQNAGFEYKFEDCTSDYLEKYQPIYSEIISQKDVPDIHDLRSRLDGDELGSFAKMALSLYKNGVLIGGNIFSIQSDILVNHFNAISGNLGIKIKVNNIGFLSAYQLALKAIELNKQYFSQGRDTNVYGRKLSIGLAIFKLRCGSQPLIPNLSTIEFEDNFVWDREKDYLIFKGNILGEPIKEADLYLIEKDQEIINNKYGILFKQDFFTVNLITL